MYVLWSYTVAVTNYLLGQTDLDWTSRMCAFTVGLLLPFTILRKPSSLFVELTATAFHNYDATCHMLMQTSRTNESTINRWHGKHIDVVQQHQSQQNSDCGCA